MKTHAAIIILNDHGKALFIKRSENKKTLPGAWSFPSGTLEKGESATDAAIREAKEELDVTVNPLRSLATCKLGEFGVILDFITCKITYGQPTIMEKDEISDLRWMSFRDFFDKFSDKEIGHGLIWLRKNKKVWQTLS